MSVVYETKEVPKEKTREQENEKEKDKTSIVDPKPQGPGTVSLIRVSDREFISLNTVTKRTLLGHLGN
jgi:hypothetical protein